jgi:hypothetical protein
MKETDFQFGGSGNNYYYPGIRPDSNGDMVAVFSGSSDSKYPSLYAGVSLSPEFGSLQSLTLLHAGDKAYTQQTRWGDYSGAATDSTDGTVWVAGEYATSDIFSTSMWGTWISRIVSVTNPSGGASGSTAIISGVVGGKLVDEAYVPITAQQKVAVLNMDSTTSTGALVTSIPMPPGFSPNATAADPGIQRVVAISYNSPDVQIIDTSDNTLGPTLTAPVTRSAFFSGGRCMICGVLVDSSTNSAILDTADGYIILNLVTRQFSPFIGGTVPGENFGFDQATRIVLNPTYSQGIPAGLQAVRLADGSVFNYSSSVGNNPDAAAVDTNTDIAVVPDEFTGNQYLINMHQSAYSSGTFSAPSAVFPLRFTTCGSELHDWSLVSVESVTHLLFLGTEFADCAAVETLPSSAISGAPPLPATFHWGHMPSAPDGLGWNNGGDPHGITVFTSVVNGKSYGFLVRNDQAWVARIDMAGVRNTSPIPGGGLNQVDLKPFVFFLKTQ